MQVRDKDIEISILVALKMIMILSSPAPHCVSPVVEARHGLKVCSIIRPLLSTCLMSDTDAQ